MKFNIGDIVRQQTDLCQIVAIKASEKEVIYTIEYPTQNEKLFKESELSLEQDNGNRIKYNLGDEVQVADEIGKITLILSNLRNQVVKTDYKVSFDDGNFKFCQESEVNCRVDNPNKPVNYTKELLIELQREKSLINYEKIRELIRNGADINFRNDKGQELQEIAGLKGRYDVCELLSRARYSDV